MIAALALVACDRAADRSADAQRGKELLWQYGCGACHEIPEVKGATGNVGPPLDKMAHQVYIAGVLPNTFENLVYWILDPPKVDPLTAMPDLGVTEAQARDMAAFLYRDKHKK
jgi:cytochrome c2